MWSTGKSAFVGRSRSLDASSRVNTQRLTERSLSELEQECLQYVSQPI